jgi:hypothetical protein
MAQLTSFKTAIYCLPRELLDAIDGSLETRGVNEGNITPEKMRKAIQECLESCGLRNLVNTSISKGFFYKLLEGYEFPCVDVATGWSLWWLRDRTTVIFLLKLEESRH